MKGIVLRSNCRYCDCTVESSLFSRRNCHPGRDPGSQLAIPSSRTTPAGFTLIEVMIALIILSTTIFTLSEIQVSSMMRVLYGREEIDRLYLIKKYAYRMYTEPEKAKKPRKKDFDEPAMRLLLEMKPIHKKSSLHKFAKRLRCIDSRGEWQRGPKNKVLPIISFVRVHEE